MGKLLSDGEDNSKLAKNRERTWSLNLSPASTSGKNVCPHSTPGCRAACVAFSGLYQMRPSFIGAARIRKTQAFFADRKAFLAKLCQELANANAMQAAARSYGYVRLNTFSDISWERMIDLGAFKYLRFYDYTKDIRRALNHPATHPTYRLTYSVNERTDPADVLRLIRAGGTAAQVRSDIIYTPQHGIIGPCPDSTTVGPYRFLTVDGDEHDNRWATPPGRVVILRLKGTIAMREAARSTGFAQLSISAPARTEPRALLTL